VVDLVPPLLLGLGGVVVGIGALGFALSARRSRQAALARLAALEVEKEKDLRPARANDDLLLRTVVETTPVAIVLFADAGDITFTNPAARQLFFEGAAVEGQNFLTMIERAPASLQRALLAEADELFSVDGESGRETFHISRRRLADGQTLIAVRSVTQEITRHEVAGLKKVIRIMSHELNNSLGPISSLVTSAKVVLQRPEHLPKLATIFDTIQERALHLQSFLDGYARLAKIPQPQQGPVAWGPFLDGVRGLWPELVIEGRPERPAYFDRAQIQQVLINLIKNAHEAGGPAQEIKLVVEASPEGGCRLSVLDRGPGMSDELIQNSLLPFFTTKPSGSGLGLALSREIVELHGGRLSLGRRAEGGMRVSVWLPDRDAHGAAAQAASLARLTLTRGP